jgi:hypothetical protein
MAEGFAVIIVFALLSFYLLNYFSQDEELSAIVSSILGATIK